uniref:Uncharacterized protein n=1 Tax=Avena sativa TaxID=4498 RepID=A0ACD5Y6U4_AVESA
MAGLGTGAPIVKVYHEKSMILPDVSRVLACLYEKNIEVERHPASSYKSLLRLQASSHVPVPFDDGLTFLEDSREICRYVAETYEHHGYPFLLGKDSLERASIEQWLHHEEHAFNPPSRSLFCHLAFPLAEEDDDIDLQKRKLEEVLEVYEQRLGDSEFLAGNKFTLADLVHLPNSHHIRESDKFVYLYDSRKNVQRWWNAISTRDSWQKVLKDIQVVEQQRKQEELEKQQQRQWLREHPPTTKRRFRLDSGRQTRTKSQTILVPPPLRIISTSPTASQAEKPLPTETSPDETLPSAPTAHKSSAVQSKHTTIFTTQQETPPVPTQSTPRLPGYPHIPVQSTSNSSIPATSPTTAENHSRTGADKPGIRGVSLPSEATERNLTANSKRRSSNEVSHNLRVFHFYEASSHTDDAEPYIEPAAQKPSDRISETDGPSNATDHVKTSPRSAKEDSGASGFWTENTATNADTLDKKSVHYTEHIPQRPAETIYGRSTDQKAAYTSPGKHGSTEAHQELQTEQWHGTVAGLSNLKGETDYSKPTQQVEPGKDVQHSSSQDSEQASTHPLAGEPVSMDRQLIQGPDMTPRTLYTDQKRDVSSMLWQKTADVRGIAEEDKASSDYRNAVLPPYAQKHAEEAKSFSADHRKDASQDAAPSSKQAAAEGPRRVTAPYPASQEFIKQARESPASRSTVSRGTQGSTEEETVESSSSKAHLLDSHLVDARPPKEFLDEDGYGSSASLQTGYGDDPYNRKRYRDAAAPKRMMSQDAFEETKMTDSASSEAQALDHQQAGAPPQKPQPAEGPQTTGSALKKRSGGEDTIKHSKDASSRPRLMAAQEVQDTLKETNAGDSLSTREPPSDTWRAPPLPRRQVDDDHSTAAPTEKRYPGTGGTVKEVEENTSMPRQVVGGDAKETLEETKFAGSAASRAQPLYYDGTDAPSRQKDAIEDPLGATSPLERRYADVEDTTKHPRDAAFKPSKMADQDARRVPTTPSKQAAEDALRVSRSSPERYPRAEETSKQPSDTQVAASKPTPIATQDARDIFRESKVADSTSSIEQPSDARAAASFQKQEVPDAPNTSASFQKRYPDVKGATKKSKVTFEETSPDSASSRVQPLDSQRDYAPSWKKEATEAPRATSPFKQRHSDVEDTTKHSDGAFKPTKIVGHDTQGTYEETKASEFGLLREQYSDTSQAATTPTEKVATEVGPGVSPPSERNGLSGEDTTTRPRGTASAPRRTTAGDASGTFQDSNPADSVSSREQPLGARQPVVTPSRQETEDSLSKISAFHKTRPFIEDSTGQGVDTVFGPRQIGAEDAKENTEETNVADSASSVRARPTYTPRTARPLSEQVEVEEDAQDKDREGRESFSAPKKMVSRDAEHTYGERKTPRSVSTEQFLDNPQASSPSKQAAAEDPHGATRGARAPLIDEAKHSQGVKGATKKSEDVTFEETKSPDSASSRVQPSDSQRDYAPSWKKGATEAPRATSPFKQRHSDVEDTAKHSRDNVFKPRQMVGQDTQGTYEETKASDFGLLREQPSDTWQAATTPTEKVATEDGPGETPSERNAPSDEDTNMRLRSTASAPRRAVAADARGTFQGSKPADSVLSREQPLSARQPAVTPSRQGIEDSHSKIAEFHKTRPFVEDSTRQGVDTVVGPRQSGAEDAKDITEETKVADSASSVRARPTYTPRAHPLSEQAEVEEDAQDKDREGRETISAPMKMVPRDGEHTYGERKIPHSSSREQSLDNLQASSPLKQAAAEDSRGATRGAKESLVDEPKTSQDVKGASKISVGTAEERKGPGSTLPTAQPLSAQDSQRTDRSSRTPTADQRNDAPTQLQSNLQDTYKEVKSPSAYRKDGDDADSGSPTKVERKPSVYQEDHFVGPDIRQQPQILPTGVRADGSTPKRQQAPVVPSTSEEKSTPSTPPRAKAHDDHTAEEPVKRDTVDNPKGAPLLLGREPTSQVQRATELTPDGDMSNKPSSIDQWRLASVPIQGVTPNSGDDVQGVSTIDQKPTPMSQQSIPSARGADEMVKREQRMVPSAPAGAQTPDVQQDPSSFAGADRTERDGEPVQMQARTLRVRPTSVPTRRATPDARDAGDNEFVDTSDAERWKALKAKHDSAMIDEDVRDASLSTHDATGDNKTTWQASEAQVSDTLPGSTATPVIVQPTSGDELVERFSHDQGAKRPESTQTQTPSDPPRDSVSTQGVPSDALDKTKFVKPSSTQVMRPTAGPASAFEAQLAEHKFAPSDKKSAGAAQPLSSVESREEDTSVSVADQTKKPQTIFRQEARPSTPVTKQIPSSNAYHGKVQQVTLDNLPTDDSPTPHVPSYEQVSHAPTIPVKKDMTPAPGTSNSPASNTQIPSAKFQEAIPDNYRPDELTVPFVSSEKQGSYAGSSTELHEGPSHSHDANGVAYDKDITKYPSSQAPVLEYRPDSTPADSNVRPTSGDEPGILPDQGAESPSAAQETNSEDRRNEVFPAEKKYAPSDQDSVNSVQQRSPAETMKGETIVAAAEQTLPTNIGQQHTQDMRETPTSDFVPAEDIPSDAQSGKSDEQKFASPDQDTQQAPSVEPRNEGIRNSIRSAQPLFSAAEDQTKGPQTTIGQQGIAPTPGASKSPSSDTHHASGKFQEVAPDDHHTVESFPNQGQVSRTKPSFVPSEGPTHDSHTDIDKKTTKLPSSQAESSELKPDPRQNRSDEPPTRSLPSPLPKQNAETQALAPPVGSYDHDSKSSQDVTSDTLGKVKSPKPSSIYQEASGSTLSPDTHLGSAPGDVAPAGQKLLSKDQDSAHPTQKSSSSEPSSGSQYAPQMPQEITPKDQRITGSIPRQQQVPHISKPHDGPTPDLHGAFVEEPMAHTTGLTPHAQYGMVPSGLSPDVEKLEISDSDHHTQPSSSFGSRKEEGHVDASDQTKMPAPGTGESSREVLQVGPGNHESKPLPVVEARKEESTGAGQQDIRHAPGILEHVLDDDHKKEPVPTEEQVSHDQRASEPREGSPPDVHGASHDKKTTPPSNQAQSSDAKRDLLPMSVDVDPSSGQQSTTRVSRVQGTQLPALTRPLPLHESLLYSESNEAVPESSKPPSANQEVTYPKVVPASAPDTMLGTTSDEIAPDGHNFPLSARSAQRPFSVEPTKQKDIVAPSDQTNKARTIIGQQGVSPTDKEETPFDLHASELAKPPNEDQEQVHAVSADEKRERPTGNARGAVDKKMPHPSSQAENSDITPDSAPTSGNAHRTSVGGPTTSSRDSETQPPTRTQIAPALFLEKIESPTPPSTDKDPMTPRTSPAPAPEAPQDQDLATTQVSPSVVSGKDVADQTNVAQAGLREPASSGSTRPSEKIREFSPDAYVTESEKSLPPMKGADPVQPPYEASLDLSSDEKTTMIKGDQANTISNVNLSVSQAVGQPANSAVKGPLSEESASLSQKNLERTSPEVHEGSTQSPQLSPSVVSRKDVADANQTDVPQTGPIVPGSSNATLPSEKIEKFSTDASLSMSAKPLLPMTGVDPVQPPDLSSDGKPTMIKGEQANTASNISLSANQAENSAVKRPLSEESVSLLSQKNLERTLPEEKSKQQTDQSSTRLSNDDNIEASGTANPNIKTTGDLQPSPLMESMHATEGSRNQEQANLRSTQDNKKKTQENESQDNGSSGPEETRPDSAPISGDGQATSSLHDSQVHPPAGTEAVIQSIQDNERQIEETEAQDNVSYEPQKKRPDSAQISGDARRTSDDDLATSLRDSRAQPPARTLNGPAVFLENIKSPRPPSTDQEPMTLMTSPTPAPGALQDKDSTRSPQLSPSDISRKDVANADQTTSSMRERSQAGLREPASSDATRPLEEIQEFSPDASHTKSAKPLPPMTGTDPDQPPHEASLDLSSDGKPATIKSDQANTISNVSLPASQVVGQSKNGALKGQLSEDLVSSFSQKSPEGTPTEEKPDQQQRTDQSNTRSSEGGSIPEARGTTDPEISTSGDAQPSPLKESTQAAEGSRNQQHADQPVDENQFEETVARVVGPDEVNATNLKQSRNQKNNGASQKDALGQPEERVPVKDSPGGIQEDNRSANSPRTSEESEQQVQTEGKTQGGETKAPAAEPEQQTDEKDLPSSNKGITSESQAKTSYKLEEQASSGTKSRDTDSSESDGSSNDTKPADTNDNPPSS